jgi:hypothetical protein
VGRGDDLAAPDDDGTHGHLARLKGFFGLGEGKPHEFFIAIHRASFNGCRIGSKLALFQTVDYIKGLYRGELR